MKAYVKVMKEEDHHDVKDYDWMVIWKSHHEVRECEWMEEWEDENMKGNISTIGLVEK